jgi:lipase
MLALEEWGEPGEPRAVCLHGVTSHGRHFTRLAEDGLAGFHVLAPDLLGHGSSRYEPPWSIDAHLAAIVATVGTEPAVLIGHSFGGRLAFEIAARAPKLVPRLVLLDPAILVPSETALAAAENARKDRAYISFDEGIDRRYDESQLHRAPRDSSTSCVAPRMDDDGYRYRYCQAAVVAAYGEMASPPPPFEQVRVPTLLVLGNRSYLPYDHLFDATEALGDLLEIVFVAAGTPLWTRRGDGDVVRASSPEGPAPCHLILRRRWRVPRRGSRSPRRPRRA